MTILFGSSENNSQSIDHHGGGACVTESMLVLTDPATYGILNSELTNCPRRQQMMGTLQRVEQEAVSSQSLANAIEGIGRTRMDATVSRLRLKDGEQLYPKSWSGGTPVGCFAREVAAWLGYVDPKHEAGKLIQRITSSKRNGPEDHSHGAKSRVGGMALVDGCAPKSSNDPAIALQPILATPKRCKDAKELKERLTAWSLKSA